MNEDIFKIAPEDKGLVITYKKEANIKLASIKNITEANNYVAHAIDCIRVLRAIEASEPSSSKEIDAILDDVNTIWRKGILSPLTLKDDEFDLPNAGGIRLNTRYPYIYIGPYNDKEGNPYIYNSNAYKLTIRHHYDDVNKAEVTISDIIINGCPQIFINKGGCITGHFINLCRIRPEIVNKHNYTIQSIINIPASSIFTKEFGRIYTVDHREPKLKVLRDFYEVNDGFYDDVDNAKIDIRKYKKL